LKKKITPQVDTDKHVPSDEDIYASVGGKRGGGKFGSSGTIMSDKRRERKDFNKTAKEAADERTELREGDHCIKQSPDENASNIYIGEQKIIIAPLGGAEGVSVETGKGVVMQGDIKINNYGKGITKAHFTENPESADKYTQFKIGQTTVTGGYPPHDHVIIPHRHELEPAYLYKMPPVDLLDEKFMKMLTDFIENFFKKG